LIEALGKVFGACVNFVITVATVDPQRRMQAANFVDAVVDRVVNAGNEIAGDNGEVCAYIIGHVYRTAHRTPAHVAAQVNVGNLDDLHAIQFWRQTGQGNLDTANFIAKTLGGVSVHHAKERGRTGYNAGRTEKGTARRVRNMVLAESLFVCAGTGLCQRCQTHSIECTTLTQK